MPESSDLAIFMTIDRQTDDRQNQLLYPLRMLDDHLIIANNDLMRYTASISSLAEC